MSGLESWLKQATRCLSNDSTAQVRTEIVEHYESARAAAMERGASAEEASLLAVIGLGDAKAANLQYRKVLLSPGEARMLREGNWEARVLRSCLWLKWLLAAVPMAALLAAITVFLTGAIAVAWTLLLGGMVMGILFAAPFLPIYTPWRGRGFRVMKWVLLIGVLCLSFGQDALKLFWLLASCVWIPIWTEWTRMSIRRKMPVAKWPKHLYL